MSARPSECDGERCRPSLVPGVWLHSGDCLRTLLDAAETGDDATFAASLAARAEPWPGLLI